MSNPVQLTLSELESYRGQGAGQQAGKYLRYFCPIHGSDSRRSLSLNPETGRFRCFACAAWGYVTELRAKWRERNAPRGPLAARTGARSRASIGGGTDSAKTGLVAPPSAPEWPRPRPALEKALREFQAALPGTWGEEYLRRRGIPLDLAQACGVGYAAPGLWPHKSREWKWGRLVFPHTTPAGEAVNLYGRAVGSDAKVPKEVRHAHLPGPRGVFNAQALAGDTVFICEGVFDALSLMAAGPHKACAIFGVDGLRWEWVKAKRVVFCLDQDAAGERWRALAWEGVLRGKEVYFLPAQAYGGYKDLNEAWVATGRLDIGAWEAPRRTDPGDPEGCQREARQAAEVRRPCPDAAGAPSFEPEGSQAEPPPTPGEEAVVRLWLAATGEGDSAKAFFSEYAKKSLRAQYITVLADRARTLGVPERELGGMAARIAKREGLDDRRLCVECEALRAFGGGWWCSAQGIGVPLSQVAYIPWRCATFKAAAVARHLVGQEGSKRTKVVP